MMRVLAHSRCRLYPQADTRQHERHVRFGSLADICSAKWHVRFTPKSGHGSGGAFYLVVLITFVEEDHQYGGNYYNRH